MLVGNDDLALKFIFLLLFQSVFFLSHVIARDKHCVEKFRRREGRLLSGNSSHENRLAFILGSILILVEGCLGLECLLNVWITKSFDLRWVGFLYMLVPIWFLALNVKTFHGPPFALVVQLGFQTHVVLVDQGEWAWKVVTRVRIEVFLVLRDHLAHLVFLNLHNVVLLVSIWINFKMIWHIDPSLRRSSLTQWGQCLLVKQQVIRFWASHGALA